MTRKYEGPRPRLIGDIQVDFICKAMLEASRAYGAGEISEEDFAARRAWWGRCFLATQGIFKEYRQPGGGAGQ